MNNDLISVIIPLIKTKREDDYWDFKHEHHKNKAELLHDILCMANSLHNKDCYIILGVENETGNIVGVDNNNPRRNQQCIIDFLKSKKFAGDHRPKIELHTFTINEHEVDVITVLNTTDTPYFLSELYRDKDKIVSANAIYTRIGDTNTPLNSAADYSQVEYLWKKRLGLHLSPFERLCWLIRDKSQWERNEEYHYNKQYPEFTLQFEDREREHPVFYSYMMTNESTSYGMIRANYYGTTLYSHEIVHLDSGRYFTTTPAWEFIPLDCYHHENLSFKYFIKDSISFLLHLYLLNNESREACYARSSFLEVVLIFSSEYEKEQFLYYVEANKALLLSRIEADENKNQWRVRCEREPAKSVLTKEIATGITLKQMLQEFRRTQEEDFGNE